MDMCSDSTSHNEMRPTYTMDVYHKFLSYALCFACVACIQGLIMVSDIKLQE